jgi:acyl dehydratase
LIGQFVREAIQIESPARLTVNYGLNRVRFPAAVRSESRIRARVALLAWKELSDSMEAIYSITVENEQSDKPSCVAEWIVRYYV